MIWQPLLVGLILLAATVYLVRQTWRTWFSAKAGCGGGCSCAGKKTAAAVNTHDSAPLISVNELTQRLRERK